MILKVGLANLYSACGKGYWEVEEFGEFEFLNMVRNFAHGPLPHPFSLFKEVG